MFGNSTPVVTNQTGPNKRLNGLILVHRDSHYQRPVSKHNLAVFQKIESIREHMGLPIVLDSGCGNGESSVRLAQANTQHLVIGIDKSEKRLGRFPLSSNLYQHRNLILVRADLVDLWRLAAEAGWQLDKHFLLYPNPWPKQKHLKRRWYAHPVFPSLIHLGGVLEVRTNWAIYIDEFSLALRPYGIRTAISRLNRPDVAISPFEHKYHSSGHALYRLVAGRRPHWL